jgi:hypothetical protein
VVNVLCTGCKLELLTYPSCVYFRSAQRLYKYVYEYFVEVEGWSNEYGSFVLLGPPLSYVSSRDLGIPAIDSSNQLLLPLEIYLKFTTYSLSRGQ